MKAKRKSGLLYRYIIINIAIFAIPLLLLLCFWGNSQCEKGMQEYLEREKSTLSQSKEYVETTLQNLERMAYQISYDRKINFYQWSQGTYDSVLSTQQMQYYRSGLNEFSDLVICFEGSTKLFQSGGISEISAFPRSYALGDDLVLDELYNLMNSRGVYSFLALPEYLKKADKKYTIVTYPITSVEQQKYATLSGVLEYDYLERCFPESEISSRAIICNRAGELLYANEEMRGISENLLETVREHVGLTKYEENGTSYYVIGLFSEETQLYYIRMIASDSLRSEQMKKVMPEFFLMMVIGILVVAVLAAMIAFYNYVPIRNLLRMFDCNIDCREKQNELLLINDYIQELQKRNRSLNQMIEEKNMEQIRNVLVETLYGRYNMEAEDIHLLQQHGVRYENGEFAIVMLQCEVSDSLEKEILMDRMRALTVKHLLWITQEPSNYFIFLYHASNGTRDAVQQAQILQETLQKDGYSCTIGIGSYTDSVSKLQRSLTEGILCLYHDKDGAIHVYDSECESEEKIYTMNIMPGKEELLLLFAIQKGDKEQILDTVNRMEEEFGKLIHYYRSNEIRFKLYRVIDYLRELPGISEESLREHVKKLIYYKDMADFFVNFRECINAMLTNDPFTHEIKGITIQKIQDFMDKNFSSPEMSLTYVADHFKIRSSYLSTFFKESTGINFITYIQEKRMECARCMLCETKLSIQQIVVEIGYSDVPSFTKKFSSKYGMPPGAYRKTMQNAKYDTGEEMENSCEMTGGDSGKTQ